MNTERINLELTEDEVPMITAAIRTALDYTHPQSKSFEDFKALYDKIYEQTDAHYKAKYNLELRRNSDA
jgi:hypothetical protein